MAREGERFNFLPGVVAAIGFIVFAAIFACEMGAFRQAVIGWAARDLETRTELAAANLGDAIRAADFSRIHSAGEVCRGQGLRLTIYSRANGLGLIYDSLQPGEEEVESLYKVQAAGSGEVRLGLPLEQVLAPFRRAQVGFCLAGLMGGAAVLLVLLFTYRQHVRMRELARLEKFRREFVADISHEIKTPLTGILGAVELLMDDPPKEVREKLLGMVKKESTRLNALAQDVVSLARLEHEGAMIHREEVDLAAVLNEVAERFRVKALAAGMDMRVEGASQKVKVDFELMARAVSNLVENAIRYSKSKDVILRVERVGARVRICVEDHGIGIAKEQAARVFERFHRVDWARAADLGGAGLGLAIVRSIAQAHGGSATLENAQPAGCRFVITLSA